MFYGITKNYKYDKVNLIIVLIVSYINYYNIGNVHISFDILFDNREIGYSEDYSRVVTAERY